MALIITTTKHLDIKYIDTKALSESDGVSCPVMHFYMRGCTFTIGVLYQS